MKRLALAAVCSVAFSACLDLDDSHYRFKDGGVLASGGGQFGVGGGFFGTGGGSASTGGGSASTGGGSASTGGGSASTGGGSASTGGGSASTGGGSASTGGGSASTGGGSVSTGGGSGDTTAPSTSGAVVLDGTTADLSAQRDTTSLTATWSGFTDAQGVTGYEYNLSNTSACAGEVLAAVNVGTVLTKTSTGLSLSEKTYFNCVRARDAAGNWSKWVSSNGIAIDLTPPSLTSSSPANSTVAAEPSAAIVLTFSEPIAATSKGLGQFALSNLGKAVAFQLTWSADSKIATLVPSHPLEHLTLVTVTVQAGLADGVSNATTLPITINFTTRDWSWVADAGQLASGNNDTLPFAYAYETLAIDGQGRAAAVWAQNPAWRLVASNYDPATGWSKAARLSTMEASQNYVDLALNARGDGVAAWVQDDGTLRRTYAATYRPDAGWAPAQLLDSSPAIAGNPGVAIDGTGVATVVWPVRAADEIWANRFVDGGWVGPTKIATVSTGNSWWDIVVTGNEAGDVMVVYGEYTPTAVRYSGAAWSAPMTVNSLASQYGWSLAMASDGTTIVTSTKQHSPDSDLYASIYKPGVGWQTQLMPAAADGNSSRFANWVAIDDLGNAWVTWIQNNAGKKDAYGRRYSAGSWSAPQLLAANALTAPIGLTKKGDGHLMLGLLDLPTGTSRMYLQEFSLQTGWAAPLLINNSEATPEKLVVGAGGQSAVIYSTPTGLYSAFFN